MRRVAKSFCAILAICVPANCSGGSSSPTAPTRSTTEGHPVVTIQLTYSCRPCTTDPDNYSFGVQGGGGASRRPGTTIETETLTWTGPLAPGPHYVDVRIQNPHTSWSLAFMPSGTPRNSGGIKPFTVRVLDRGGPVAALQTLSRCGMLTAFVGTPPAYYNPVYEIDVVLGGATEVC